MRDIVLTFLPALTRPSECVQRTVTWDELCDWFTSEAQCYVSKNAAPLFGPYRLTKPHRKNDNVIEITALVLDLDSGGWDDVLGTLEKLKADNIAFCASPTYSHTARRPKYRVIVQLASPIPAAQFRLVWAEFIAKYAPQADPQCKDASRAYYVPSQPGPTSDPDRQGLSVIGAGQPFDWRPLARAISANEIEVEEAGRVLDRDTLSALCRKWTSARNVPEVIDSGYRLRKVLEGLSYAEPGERDVITFRLVGLLASAYPDIDVPSTCQLFARSLSLMALQAPEGAITTDLLAAKLLRAKTAAREKRAAPAKEAAQQLRTNTAAAFGGARTEGYSEAELDATASALGIDIAHLSRCWILQHGRDYYVLSPSPSGEGCEYVHQPQEALANYCRVSLAPAGISVELEDENGKRRTLSASELVARYGTVVRSVQRTLCAAHAAYNVVTGELLLPTCPRRKLTPAYDKNVQQWLEALGGEDAHRLLDWIALALNPDHGMKPLQALALYGCGGTGKSLLGHALSRIWHFGGPVDGSIVMGNFTAGVEKCPVVLFDEGLPTDHKGEPRTDKLRHLIQSSQHVWSQKFQATSSLLGALRCVITANNDMFLGSSSATSDDIGAVAERICDIKVQRAAKTLIERLDLTLPGGIRGGWVESDVLTRHLLWVSANREVQPAGRFMMKPKSRKFARNLSINSGLRDAICEWLIGWMRDPSRVMLSSKDLLERRNDSVLVSSDTLRTSWESYIEGRRPSSAHVTAALRILCANELDEDASPSSLGWQISYEVLQEWCQSKRLPFPS